MLNTTKCMSEWYGSYIRWLIQYIPRIIEMILPHTHLHDCNMTENTSHWQGLYVTHDDVIKWKHFMRYLPFVRGIHRSPATSPRKGQRRGGFMFPLICTWTNGRANNRNAGDLRHNRAHYDVTVVGDLALTNFNASTHDKIVNVTFSLTL